MRLSHCPRSTLVLASAILICSPSLVGCVGLVANLLHVGWGNQVQAKYEGLEGQRVAVVCVSQSSMFGPTQAALDIAEEIQDYLRKEIVEIQVIDQQEMDQWMDEHDWNQIDYRELGQGVGAQKLIAVELSSFSLYEGKTLFKGRADIELVVFDLTQSGSDPVFEEIPPQIQYPVTTGQYTADTSEATFHRRFIDVIANQIARNFYAYDVADDFGRDPTSLGF
jgi:hypothetical protein